MSTDMRYAPYLNRSRILRKIDTCWGALFYHKKLASTSLLTPSSNPLVRLFFEEHGFFSSTQPLWGVVSASLEDTKRALHFLKTLPLCFKEEKRSQVFLELLAKVVAFRFLEKGMKVGSYVVDEIFDLGHGFPAFGLVCIEGKEPLLLFRGTDLTFSKRSAWVSIASDFDWRGPGFSLYQRARPLFRKWLNGKQARALGFSLGGILASYAALFEGDLLHPHLPSLSFNGPGLYRNKQTLQVPLISYQMEGDPVSCVGKLLGKVEPFCWYEKVGPISAHQLPLFFSDA